MILIEDIKYRKLPGNTVEEYYQIRQRTLAKPQGYIGHNDSDLIFNTVIDTALNKGIHCKRLDGSTVIIGNTVKCAELLGMQFDAWEYKEQQLKEAYIRIDQKNDAILKLQQQIKKSWCHKIKLITINILHTIKVIYHSV